MGGQVTPLRDGDAYSVANAINSHDLVVGSAIMDDGQWAFAWQAGTMTELPHLPGWDWSTAYDVNDAGQIVGMAVLTNGSIVAVAWSTAGVVVLPGLSGTARSINARGDIAGSADGLAVVWSKGKISKVLGTLGGTNSYAMGINNAGRVVGTSLTGPAEPGIHAFLYRIGMVDLGTLSPWLTSEARAISNQSIVIGHFGYL